MTIPCSNSQNKLNVDTINFWTLFEFAVRRKTKKKKTHSTNQKFFFVNWKKKKTEWIYGCRKRPRDGWSDEHARSWACNYCSAWPWHSSSSWAACNPGFYRKMQGSNRHESDTWSGEAVRRQRRHEALQKVRDLRWCQDYRNLDWKLSVVVNKSNWHGCATQRCWRSAEWAEKRLHHHKGAFCTVFLHYGPGLIKLRPGKALEICFWKKVLTASAYLIALCPYASVWMPSPAIQRFVSNGDIEILFIYFPYISWPSLRKIFILCIYCFPLEISRHCISFEWLIFNNNTHWPLSLLAPPGGGRVLPYMGYIGMCGLKGYGFSAVLVINRVSILADFGHCGHK